MKNAKKMTVAAGFISLLFAPLAQAQTPSVTPDDEGRILFEVVRSAVTVEATNINFGTVVPGLAAGNSINIELNCVTNLVTSLTPGDFAEFRDTAGSQCGEIQVAARGEGTDYKLEVEVGQLSTGGGGANETLDPTLIVYGIADNNGNLEAVTGLNSISGSASSSRVSILSGETDTYKVGGGMLISAEHRTGSYNGQYTVSAIVR